MPAGTRLGRVVIVDVGGVCSVDQFKAEGVGEEIVRIAERDRARGVEPGDLCVVEIELE